MLMQKKYMNSEKGRTSTRLFRVILDAKYEKKGLNKVIKNQCQNLTETQRNELMKSLQKFKYIFDGTLVTRKTDLVDFELKRMRSRYV